MEDQTITKMPDAAVTLDNARDAYEQAILDYGRKDTRTEKTRLAYHEVLTQARNLGERNRIHAAFQALPTPDSRLAHYNESDVHDLINKLFPA